MNKIAVILVLLFGSLTFAQNANSNDPNNQGKDPKDQKDQKEQKEPNVDLSTYHSPYTSDISKSSFGASKGAFTQGSVTNASPQRAAGAPAPTIDFHHKDARHSSTAHDPKANPKASYDPGQYKAKAHAKLPQ